MKSILIEPANDEELKLVKAFIKEHKIKGFLVEDSKATETNFLDDVIRIIPIKLQGFKTNTVGKNIKRLVIF